MLADPFSLPPVPGLLRYCAPVLIHPRLRLDLGGASTGVVWQADDVNARVFFGYEFRSFRPSLADVRLDYSNSFGRHCAREWLAERGHPTTEDRAEVLAWSVESVRRGGKPLQVLPAWESDGYGIGRSTDGGTFGRVRGACWWAARPDNDGSGRWDAYNSAESDNAAKAAADAALLALGWALTNADGSLTLPPLPEVQDGR